ncbi:MAG: OmpA family protein [Saprospiraceae bacterium]
MRIPLWLILLLFAGWTAWFVNHFYCGKCGCCGRANAAITPSATVPDGTLLFNWNNNNPIQGAGWDKFKNALMARGGSGDTLRIVGHYRANEPGGEELGLARAREARKLFPEVPDDRVRLSARLIDGDGLTEGGAPKESTTFDWLAMSLKKDESAIIESDKSASQKEIVILFPFNSSIRQKDAKIEAYLKELGEAHKNDAATFTVVGHTDNIGSEAQNDKMGLDRAESIRKTLTGYGIAKNRIQVSSRGQRDPVADNSTDEGRQRNRRVVITVTQ